MWITHDDENALGRTMFRACRYVIAHSANMSLVDDCKDALALCDELDSYLLYVKTTDPE